MFVCVLGRGGVGMYARGTRSAERHRQLFDGKLSMRAKRALATPTAHQEEVSISPSSVLS